MALLFVKAASVTPVAPASLEPGFSWDAWYEANKDRLSEKRAKRYREDPEYRAKALARSRQQRETKKQPVTDGHTLSFNDMATTLGITVWVLREWRRKNYFPEPYRREGRLWFKPEQTALLQTLQTFFQTHGIRVGEAKRSALENVVQLVYANW